ncbi:putative choline transporter, neither null mutation nor overexpression affects choline transport [Rhizophlyctis rosea]|nr:putative choline transporter, neither null mutation nor overexpression affects choline transport [Rhizophlyctis rosea]
MSNKHKAEEAIRPASAGGLPSYDAAGSHRDYVEENDAAPLLGNKEDEAHPNRFSNYNTYKDVWATIAFVVHLVVLSVIAVIGYKTEIPPPEESDPPYSFAGDGTPAPTPPPTPDNGHLQSFVTLAATAVIGGLVLSILYFMAIERYTKKLIKVSFIVNTIFAGVLSIYYLLAGNILGGVLLGLYATIHVIYYLFYRAHIPFTTIMLETVTSVTKRYPATIFTGVVGLVVQVVASTAWMVATVGSWRIIQANKDNDALRWTIIIYSVFSFYWLSQVISNTVHVTVCGVFATYYFTGVSNPDGSVTVPVRNPTVKSAKRALTTSFGSIVFGSLIIALIQTLHFIARAVKDNARQEGNKYVTSHLHVMTIIHIKSSLQILTLSPSSQNSALALVAACLECLISLLQGIIDFINVYAFTQVAVYGKPYIQAARDTWTLIQRSGVELIINDDLTRGVLFLGGIFVGAVNTFVAYVALRVMSLTGEGQEVTVFVTMAFAFFVGVAMFGVLSEAVYSGVATTFVCLAEDPEALQRTKPELFNAIRETYPGTTLTSHVQDV